LENNVKDCLEEQDAVSETLSGIKIKFEKLEAKIDRIQIYINIVAFVMASIIAPLLVAYISKILIGG